MEILDKVSGIIGYAVIKAEDGSIEEVKGTSASPLGDLAAFFSSAGEVIKNSLSLGNINYVSLCYGGNRLIIFPYESKYLGIEIDRDGKPLEFIKKIVSAVIVETRPQFELPRSISSKVMQINLLLDEFSSESNKAHWLEVLNQGLGILGGEILPYMGIIEGKLIFKDKPSDDKEDEFVQGLRTIIDFLVKKAVEELGTSQARVKVQAVIEKMRVP